MNDINELYYLDKTDLGYLKDNILEITYTYITENISLMSQEEFHSTMFEDIYQYVTNVYINVMDKYLDLIIKIIY